MREHSYNLSLRWTGNKGTGTSGYSAYERSHIIQVENKPDLFCSSDPSFRGDISKYNPEELLVASLSGCHMLWFLHLCAVDGIVVTHYSDHAFGVMFESPDGSGRFKEVILKPQVIVAEPDMIQKANELHDKAHEKCFIANSVNFPVKHEPVCSSEV